MADTNNTERAAFEAWAERVLGDNPNWRESGVGELARQAWLARAALAPSAGDEPCGWKWRRISNGADGVYWENPGQYGLFNNPDYEWTPLFTRPQPPEAQEGWRAIETFSEDEADEVLAWKPGLGRVLVTWLPEGHPDAEEGAGWHEVWSHKRIRGITHGRVPPPPPSGASKEVGNADQA